MAPPMTRRRKAQQDLMAKSHVETPESDDTNQRDLPVRAKDEDAAKAPVQGTMKVFGDDDDIDASVPVPSKPAAPVEEEEEEEESSDDEAPEAVSTTKAASEAIKSAQAAQKTAQKAAQEKANAQKRKRQQQDALFKQQASERKKHKAEDPKSDEEASGDEAETPAESVLQTRKAPNLLPAEFLTDSSSEEEGSDDDAGSGLRPRKRVARKRRAPKDQRVGSTVYRVARKVDERMVPKSSKQAKHSRDLLLKRNRSVEKQRSGFFVR